MADNPKKDVHQWARNLLEDGLERRKPFEAEIWENLAAYAGDLWAEWNVSARRLEAHVPTDRHRVRIPINLNQSVVRTELAKLTKNRPIVYAVPRSSDKSDLNAAKVGDSMLNEYAEKQFAMPRVRRRALQWVLTTGFGGIFVDYDETLLDKRMVDLDPQGKPVFDEQSIELAQQYYKERHQKPKQLEVPQGDLVIDPFGPMQFIYDLSTNYFEKSWWAIFTDAVDVDEIYRRWNVEIKSEDDAVPGIIERRLLARTDLTGKMRLGNIKSQRLAKVHRLYVKPGHRWFPDGLHLAFTDDEVILEEKFPFGHGELPFAVMGHIPMPGVQYGMSAVSFTRPVVLELSKTSSQLIENRNLMANIPWIEYEQNRIEGDIENAPGARISVWYQPGVPDPHPIEMPEMPAYVREMIPQMKEHILDLAGQGETSQGRVPAGARSGVAIAYLQEEDDTRLGPTVQEFEEMIERCADQMLHNFAEFYDAPRTIHIYNGPNKEPEVFDFIGTQLEGVASVGVQTGSGLPRSKAAKQQFILDLYDRGLEQDPRRIREMLELSKAEPDEWEKAMEQAERENRRMAAGDAPEVYEWHNHPVHHMIHRGYMMSQDWENLDPKIRQLFVDHDAAHTAEESQQQMDQMVAGSGVGGPGAPANGSAPLPTSNGQNQQTAPAHFTSPDGLGNVIEASPQ